MTPAESTVIRALKEVMVGKGLQIQQLCPETILDKHLGLESLDFAELVIRLEESTGKDPFGSGVTPQIRTVSDLAALYEIP